MHHFRGDNNKSFESHACRYLHNKPPYFFPLLFSSFQGYLGYFDSESYGLTWKVRGFCVDKSNPEVFETSNVYGDIIGSNIHHMYYGMYSYGHQGGVWTDNEMHDNYQYGFDPHDDSDYLTIAHNKVYNNVNHGEYKSMPQFHVTILREIGARLRPVQTRTNRMVYRKRKTNQQQKRRVEL